VGGAFFGPRRIRVTLRPELQADHHHGSRVDNWDARSISSTSSTSTSSTSSSSSDGSRKHQKRGGKQHCVPHHGWVSHAAAASASSWRVQMKLEREQKKAERKAERKARRLERKERKRERKIARQESKAMRKGKFIPPRPGAGRWGLLVECI